MDPEYSPSILIVDDNEENLLTLKSNLRQLNAIIKMAQSGKEAVLHTRQRDFALIIMDVQMPEMDGYQTAEKIRQGRMNQFTPIIFLTAVYFDQSNIMKGYQTGAVDYITKPFNREILLSKVKTFLDLDRAKSELNRTKISFENVVQDQTDLICRTDSNFMIAFANQAYLLAFSTTLKQIRSKSVLDNFSLTDWEKINHALLLLTPNNPIIKLNHFLNISEGHRLSVTTVFRVLFDENFKLAGYQLVIRDITREKQIREELLTKKRRAESAAESIFKLLANLGHDLKTPLNSIIGMIEVLTESNLDQDQQEDVQVIRKSADKLLSLLNTLNEFTIIGANQNILENRWFAPVAELSDLVKSLKEKAKEKGNDLLIHIGNDIPLKTKSDPKLIRLLLSHLIFCSNTFLENGIIEVSLEMGHNDMNHADLLYQIKCKGKRLPLEISEKILTFLHHDDPSISYNYGETALRLAVAKGLSKLLGGAINLSDDAEEGFIFTFKINFEIERPQSSNTVSILVVEDNILNQKVVGIILKNKGFVYDLASDGQAALEKYRQNHFDFILMDIRMPVMDGYEATRNIRKFENEHPTRKAAKIFALTANATSEDQKKCLTAGMNGFLTKPFNFPELEKIIYDRSKEI